MVLAILAAGALSFIISWFATMLMIRIAPQLGFVDKPGGRKIHANPKPLGGGVAIFLGIAVPLLLTLIYINTRTIPNDSHDPYAAYLSGAVQRTPMALCLIGVTLGMHVLGLIDDRRALGPYLKLGVQLALIAAFVLPFHEMRALSVLDTRLGTHGAVSSLAAILWIAAITNAFNFLDNMDGLSAGVAAVSATAFLIATLSIEQWFVAGTLAMLLGATFGFLAWNFPPARIFMGDSGSLILGLFLGILTVLTTYLPPRTQWGAGWYAVFMPVIVMALPLYDLLVVSTIRLSRGKSPFVGDTNHFSHRLVARGMSRRTAVLCLYLVTAATAIGGILLPHVTSPSCALLIFVQTLLVLGVVGLLEQHPLPLAANVSDTARPISPSAASPSLAQPAQGAPLSPALASK
jgi:UDP-GlcNAc:undecaprenyl-phosphate GlcNAc-1-phosphate transferase